MVHISNQNTPLGILYFTKIIDNTALYFYLTLHRDRLIPILSRCRRFKCQTSWARENGTSGATFAPARGSSGKDAEKGSVLTRDTGMP